MTSVAALALGCSSAHDAVPTSSSLTGAPAQEVPLSFAGISVRNEGGMARFEGARLAGKPGQPVLPVHTVRLLLDPDADLRQVAVEITDAEEKDLPGTFQVQPGRPMMANGAAGMPAAGASIVDGKDMDVYGKDALFPASNVGSVIPGQLHRFKIVEVAVVPYRWNPVTGALRALVSGRLVVRAARGTAAAADSSGTVAAADARQAAKLAGLVANFDAQIGKYQPAVSTSGVEVRSGALTAPGANTYAIVTTGSLLGRLTQFADWKMSQGFRVIAVTGSTAYIRNGDGTWGCLFTSCHDGWGGGWGDAAAENIRAWLKNNYATQKLAHVLLVGNPDPETGDVPMKKAYPSGSAGDPVPTDLYYGELSGNWDFDGDGVIGEDQDDAQRGDPDIYTELNVGRIPFYGETQELDHIVAKTIAYGSAAASGIGWRKNALLAFKSLDPDNMPNYQTGEFIRTMTLIPNGWASTRVYDQDFSGITPEVSQCTYDNVAQAWRSVPRGLAIYGTHGTLNSAGEILDLDRVPLLDDLHPSFVFGASCTNAFPEGGSLTYGLLRNGAVGAIGATRVSYYSSRLDIDMGTESMAASFAKRMVANQTIGETLGGMLLDVNHDWQNAVVHVLYGDPSLAINTTGSGLISTPPAPTGLSAQGGDSAVSLSWNTVASAGGYVVKRATTAGGPYSVVGTTTSMVSRYTDKPLANGTTHYYVVAASSAGGDGLPSAEVSATPSTPIKVQYMVGNTNPSDNVIAPYVRIVNTGTVAQPLSSIQVRYYFTDDGSSEWTFTCESASVSCDNVVSFAGWAGLSDRANRLFFIAFRSGAPSLGPGESVEVRGHISCASPLTFDESNDYAYDASRSTFADYRRIPGYVDGVLAWGDEPSTAYVPSSPQGVAATAGNGQVRLTWLASTGSWGYNVYRSEAGAPRVLLGRADNAFFLDRAVTNGVSYTYWVGALSAIGGETFPSVSNTVTPSASLPAVPPEAPTGLALTSISDRFTTVCWDAMAGATAYFVKLGTSPGGPYANIARTTWSPCSSFKIPASGETYYVVVSAVDVAGEGPVSEELAIVTGGALPARVTSLTATADAAQVSLSWAPAARATGYVIKRSVAGGAYQTVGTTTGATTFTNSGLANGTTYTYVVAGTSTLGEGTSSAPVSATTPAEPCSPAQDMSGGQSGNFNTSGPVCKRTSDNIAGWGCSNFDGRTVKVNGVLVSCGNMPLPPKFNGYYYFDVSAGAYSWASLYWWR